MNKSSAKAIAASEAKTDAAFIAASLQPAPQQAAQAATAPAKAADAKEVKDSKDAKPGLC